MEKEMMDLRSNTPRRNKWLFYLLCLYAGVVLIRFLLALITTSFPTVGIDEFLYYSLARSIATEGKLLFRGQSADYAFLLYPLVLSPVYLLFREGAHFYRLLQLWNLILMSATVFPVYGLGKKMLGSEKKAFVTAALCMLLPDFVLGELIFSEAILFPLFFTLMYCAYVFLQDDNRRCVLWIGLLGGLMYSTKPGAVVPAAVFVLVVFFRSVIRKRGKDAMWAAGSIGVFFVTVGFFWALAKYAFGYEGRLLSVYESQVDGTAARNLGAFLKALVLYPYYFILACGLVGVLYPAAAWKNREEKDRSFWRYVIVSLTVMIIGSAWVVEQASTLNVIQLRYVAMYIPLMLLFCSANEQNPTGKKAARETLSLPTGCVLLICVVLCTLCFGCKAKAKTANAYALMSISLLHDRVLPLSRQTLGNVVILALCAAAFFLLLQSRKNKKISNACVWIMAGYMLVNGIIGYTLMRETYFPELGKDGLAAQRLTEGRPYVYLLSDEGIVDIGVDVNTKKNSNVVYINDFINCLQRNKGVYTPFIPEKMRGMVSVKETPEVDTLMVDNVSFPLLQLSKSAKASSPEGHGTVYVIHFSPGERIVDSTLSNMKRRVLAAGKPGILLLYNDEYLQRPLTVRMEIESESEQTLTMNSTHELHTVELTAGKAWYEIHFDRAEEAFNFQTPDAPIKVSAYEVRPEE